MLVCQSLDVAVRAARASTRFTCVTLEGDTVSGKRGSMSGGFIDQTRCALDLCGTSPAMSVIISVE